MISPLWEVPVAVSHLFSFTVYARAWWSAFMHPLTVWLWWHISEKGGAYTNQGITWYYIMTVTSRFTFTTLNCLTPGKRVVTHIYICYVSWREEVTFWEIFPRIWEISRFARTTKVMFPGIISWGKHYFSIWMYFI